MGAFNTGSAVFLTQVVGMSASRVGLAITIAGIAEFLFAYPAGRVVDRLGPKRIWSASTFCRAACFCVLPFVGSFTDYVLLAVVATAGLGPSVRLAERFRDQHFPAEPEARDASPQPVGRAPHG